MSDTKEKRPDPAETEDPNTPASPAGPHATPELTNDDATPGAGTLPDPDDESSTDSVSS